MIDAADQSMILVNVQIYILNVDFIIFLIIIFLCLFITVVYPVSISSDSRGVAAFWLYFSNILLLLQELRCPWKTCEFTLLCIWGFVF